MLATGGMDALRMVIPGGSTLASGVSCELWLQGRNAKGQSDPGPVTVWTAP